MYGVECVKIDTLVSGDMNCTDFKSKLLKNSGRPAIVNVNIGYHLAFTFSFKWLTMALLKCLSSWFMLTHFCLLLVLVGTTVKGAIDDLDRIIRTLEKCGFQDRFYIHCDGALAGLMMPFIKQVGHVDFYAVWDM